MRIFQASSWLLFFLFLASPKALLAGGFNVTPFSQELTLQGEEKSSFYVSVQNEGTVTTTLHLTPIDFGSLDASGGAAFLGIQGNPETHYALAPWIELDREEVTLAPGQTETVQGWVFNRTDLSPGGHYGAILFREKDDPTSDSGANYIAVDQAFSSLLIVKKIGGEIEQFSLDKVDFSSNIFGLPKKISFNFSNTGNVHVTPRGKLLISDQLGRQVMEGIVNEESGILLPGSERKYVVKPYNLERSFFPGKYYIKLEYRFDGREATEVWEKSMVVIPPLSLIFGLILAMMSYFLVKKIWRKR